MPNLDALQLLRRKGIVGLRLFNLFFTAIMLFAVAVLVHGQGGSPPRSDAFTPVGRWKTVDDVTGKINSVVDIWEENGKLYGKIDRLTDPDPNDPDPPGQCCLVGATLAPGALLGNHRRLAA